MYDKELALEILTQIYQATQTVLKRFEPIKSADNFTSLDSGMEKLDAICMQLTGGKFKGIRHVNIRDFLVAD
jgi:hypothetical protein